MPATCEPPKRTPSKAAMRFARDARAAAEAADEILLRLPPGQPLDPEAQALMDSLNWNHARIEKERGRLEQVALQLADAGSNADLQDAAARLAEVERTDAAERRKIEAEFENAHRKYEQRTAALNAQLRAASEPVAKMKSARERLRSKMFVPEFVLKEFDSARSVARQKLTLRESELQQRLHLCERIPQLNFRNALDNDMVTIRSYAARNLPADHRAQPFMRERGRHNTFAVDEAAWLAHCAELQAERPAIEEELSEVRRQLAQVEAERASALDYYVRRYG